MADAILPRVLRVVKSQDDCGGCSDSAEAPSSPEPLYSVGTWDMDEQAYTPQVGLSVPCINVPLNVLRQVLRELRQMGYTAHRYRNAKGNHDDNDASVLVERTDGKSEAEILKEWLR